jgi:hypothetical protein
MQLQDEKKPPGGGLIKGVERPAAFTAGLKLPQKHEQKQHDLL